jgi:hypothetical protein
MSTKANIVAVAAVLTSLAIPGMAAARGMFLPSSYTETTNVPSDARASLEAGRRPREPYSPRPYGQW